MGISNSNWRMCNDVDMEVNSGGWEVDGRLLVSAFWCQIQTFYRMYMGPSRCASLRYVSGL